MLLSFKPGLTSGLFSTKLIVQTSLFLLVGGAFLLAEIDVHTYCFALILFLGIPHGALDYHLKISGSRPRISVRQFVLRYVLLMGAYLLMWLLYPFNALIVFVCMSIYHFGQERHEDEGLNVPQWMYMLWGGFVLLVPFLFRYEELSQYVAGLTGVQLPSLHQTWVLLFIGALIASVLFGTYWAYRMSLLGFQALMQTLFTVVLLTIAFFLLPLILSFTLYFIFFHSLNAYQHQFHWFRSIHPNYGIKQFLKELLPFTLLAYSGVAILFFIFGMEDWSKLTVLLLVLASILTLPHILVFEDFYNQRKA